MAAAASAAEDPARAETVSAAGGGLSLASAERRKRRRPVCSSEAAAAAEVEVDPRCCRLSTPDVALEPGFDPGAEAWPGTGAAFFGPGALLNVTVVVVVVV